MYFFQHKWNEMKMILHLFPQFLRNRRFSGLLEVIVVFFFLICWFVWHDYDASSAFADILINNHDILQKSILYYIILESSVEISGLDLVLRRHFASHPKGSFTSERSGCVGASIQLFQSWRSLSEERRKWLWVTKIQPSYLH